MRARTLLAVLAAATVCGQVNSAQAQTAAAAPKATNQCFFSHDWENWKAAPDSKSIYIRVGLHRYYRVDFSTECSALNMVNVHLVTHSHTDEVCSALDLDIEVSNGSGFKEPCIASALTPMTPEEVAALPKGLKP